MNHSVMVWIFSCGTALQVFLQLTYTLTMSEEKLPHIRGAMYEPLKQDNARRDLSQILCMFPFHCTVFPDMQSKQEAPDFLLFTTL